jgi:anti-sigma factor RsiW
MSTCKYEESIEDLVLTSGHDDELESHLETCERCSAALEMLMAERALFVKRAPFVPPPPIALPPVTRSVMPLVTPLFPSVFAAVACAAALFGLFVRPPAMEAPLVRAESYDEPLACAFPASGITSPGEVLASVVPDRATCEERVTSSLATP